MDYTFFTLNLKIAFRDEYIIRDTTHFPEWKYDITAIVSAITKRYSWLFFSTVYPLTGGDFVMSFNLMRHRSLYYY